MLRSLVRSTACLYWGWLASDYLYQRRACVSCLHSEWRLLALAVEKLPRFLDRVVQRERKRSFCISRGNWRWGSVDLRVQIWLPRKHEWHQKSWLLEHVDQHHREAYASWIFVHCIKASAQSVLLSCWWHIPQMGYIFWYDFPKNIYEVKKLFGCTRRIQEIYGARLWRSGLKIHINLYFRCFWERGFCDGHEMRLNHAQFCIGAGAWEVQQWVESTFWRCCSTWYVVG